MRLAKTNSLIIANAKFQDTTREISDNSVDLVLADWPFNKGIVDDPIKGLIYDGINAAARILRFGGTFVSVNYLEPNFYVWNAARQYNLTLGDAITVLRHPLKKVRDRLAYETLSILVFCKGHIQNRTLNIDKRHCTGNRVLSKKVWGVPSDFWDSVRFRNGYYQKNIGSIPEAMPRGTVRQILELYAPTGGLVVDLFGGSGTVPVVCEELGLRCVCSEILPYRFQIIKRRLYQTNQEMIAYSIAYLDKALDELTREPYTIKGDEVCKNRRQARKPLSRKRKIRKEAELTPPEKQSTPDIVLALP